MLLQIELNKLISKASSDPKNIKYSPDTTFNPANNKGKITIINFWGTWCPPCCEELPFFNQIATEYKDNVTVVAVHTNMDFDQAPKYVKDHFSGSNMVFVKDEAVEGSSYEAYNLTLGIGDYYPSTIILDENGVIITYGQKTFTYEELKAIVDGQLSKQN